MSIEMTDWYPNAEVKPVREGWYHIKWEHGGESDFNWWWSGSMWFHTPIKANHVIQARPFFWRGQTHA